MEVYLNRVKLSVTKRVTSVDESKTADLGRISVTNLIRMHREHDILELSFLIAIRTCHKQSF